MASLREKRAQLRKAAQKIGICTQCLRSDIALKTGKCKKCRNYQLQYMNKLRKENNRCSRCGQIKLNTKYKTCERCRKSIIEYQKSKIDK